MSSSMVNWIVGILLAVVVSNAIILSIFYTGYPMVALVLSAPIGLTVGVTAGIIVSRRNAQLTNPGEGV
jgi:ABC-type antimicrobial peptide transport system permease subunit